MIVARPKLLTVFLFVVAIGLLISTGILFWKCEWQNLQIKFAVDQTKIFQEMRLRALQTDGVGAASSLNILSIFIPLAQSKEPARILTELLKEKELGRSTTLFFI